MRPVVCVLLLSGLLAGLAEGYSVKGFIPQFISVQEPQKALVEDDKSFIADEDTEEGELWSSDEDPDWKPSESQEYESLYDDYGDGYDQTDEDSSEEDYHTNQEDYQTDEDYSQVEDDQTEEDGTQQDDDGQDPFPIPQGIVPQHGVLLELNDWSPSQQDEDYLFKKKRDVQSHYQTSQVVQVPVAYEIDPYRPGVSVGVEQLLPVDGPTQQEVGVGIEPVLEDKEEESGGSSVGGWFRQGWRRFTGGVEDTVGHIGDKLHETFHGLGEKVINIVGRFKVLMRKFGILIQEGVSYCLRRFKHSSEQLQESVVFEKLEKKLEEGHAEVAQFFQMLGQKMKTWREQQTSANIDAGLIEGHTQEGQDQLEEGQYSQDIEQNMPDFFQDLEVQDQLNKLRDEGILNQNDIIILTQDHTYQDQQNQQDQEQNGNYDTQQQNQQQNQQEQSQFNPEFIQFPH